MDNRKKKNIVDRVWDVFISIKLAIVLFALIALTSIVGTILEQQAEPERNIKILSGLLGDSLAPSVYGVLDAMGFVDMYHSWWFVALLMLFAVNLMICSLDRFPAIWKLVREPVKPLSEENMGRMPIKRELTLKGKPDKVKETVLKVTGYKFSEANEAGGLQLYRERGRHSRLGVLITHMSIILILIGAIVGIFFGFRGSINIPEGATYAFAFTKTGPLGNQGANERNSIIQALLNSNGDVPRAAFTLGMGEGQLTARMRRLGIEPLGFGVRVDDFEVSFYGNSDMPKDYQSTLTVIDGGKDVLTKTIEVNDPLKYKGITLYQSSYGLSGGSDVEFILRVTSRSGVSETKRVHLGEKFLIPGTGIEASVGDWSPALSFDENGRPMTYAQTMNNPSAMLEINEGVAPPGGQSVRNKWIMKRFSDTWLLEGGHIVELMDVWGAQYTGLQVRRDPGVWIVYLGCITLSLGLYVAFFINHRRLWIRLSPEKSGTRVTIAGAANKNREAYERKIDRIFSLLREGGK